MSDTKTKGMEGGAPSPEVPPKARRRTFDAAYRQRILEEADRCSEVGQIGALLRREGLYSSQLTSWRRQRLAGGLGGLEPKRRGRKSRPPVSAELTQLQAENQRLAARLRQAEAVIEVQKKISEAFGLNVTPNPSGN